jgi:hypothetical protein
MATNYSLDTVDASFSVTLRGKKDETLEFDIKYPNTAEMRAIVKSSKDFEELLNQQIALSKDETLSPEDIAFQSADIEKKVKKVSKDSQKALADLISPVGHEFAFADVLADQPINVQRKFQEIIKKEFGDGQE